MKHLQRKFALIQGILFVFLMLMTSSISAQDVADAENPVPPPYPPIAFPDQPVPPDPPFEGTFDLNAVTGCDFAAPSFLQDNMLVRATSKFVVGAIIAGTVPSNFDFTLGMNNYIGGIIPTARQITNNADPMQNGGTVSANDLFFVDGDPICLPDPRFDNAVAVFYRVFRFNVPDAVGYVRESLHWRNLQPRTLALGTVQPFNTIPEFTVQSLSVYFLEPTNLNPDVVNPLDLLDPSGGIRYCSGNGAPSFIGTGDDAVHRWRSAVTPAMEQSLINGVPLPDNWEVDEDVLDQAIQQYIDLILQGQQAVLGGGLGIYVEPAILMYDGTPLPQETVFTLIMNGPVCTEFEFMVDVPDIICGFAAAFDVYDLSCQFEEVYGGYTMYTTWWQVEVEYNGLTLGGGWFPESQAIFHRDLPEEAVFFYYMQPYDTVTGSELAGDRPIIGDPGANYSIEQDIDFLLNLGATRFDCPSDILPARVEIGSTAHAIAPQLNVRTMPNGLVIGTVPNTLALSVVNGPLCKGGFRWWFVIPQEAGYVAGWVSEADSSVYYIEPGMPPLPRPTETALPIAPPPTSVPELAPPPQDTDGDGVPDPTDACPTQGTEVSGVVGADGCPVLPQ